MRCKCGYDFNPVNNQDGWEQEERLAVIRDKDYQAFLQAEVKVIGSASGSEERLEAIATSSVYVGCAYICPICHRMTLNLPGGGPTVHYRLE